MNTFNEDKAGKAAHKWVFDKNSHKWSNNDNTAGDNYGSFIAGARWQSKRMYTQEEVEKLLDAQRGNCYVAVYNKTLDIEMASLASGAPEPWSWRKKGKKVKSGLNKNIGVDPRMIRDVPPPPEDRIIKEGKIPKPPKKK
jgi:hypothetical protein